MSVSKQIREIAEKILPEIIELRHNIHSNPELAGEEVATSELVRNTLKFTDIELLPPFLETDVVGLLKGDESGKNVALRADMDALPLNELTDVPYKSKVPGKMHACGHDGHTAMLVGAALVLNELRDKLKGSVRFVFQPGEEVVALGKKLVEAGALKNPEPDAVFALHGHSSYPAGAIIGRPGTIMAAAGFFKIRIIGKGGHGSKPEMTIDPILTGCRVVEALQSIVSRVVDPQDAAVLSVCRFEGGKNPNVIPEEVIIEGTTRFLKAEIGDKMPDLIERTVRGICDSAGAKYEFDYTLPYIPTVNDPKMIETAAKVANKYFGKNMWFDMERSSMGGEDFSYYLREYPGAFCNLGVGADSPAIHNPKFNFNDNALLNGIIFMSAMAMEIMGVK